MQNTELVVTATLCLASGGFFIFQRKIQIPPLREHLFWCVAKA